MHRRHFGHRENTGAAADAACGTCRDEAARPAVPAYKVTPRASAPADSHGASPKPGDAHALTSAYNPLNKKNFCMQRTGPQLLLSATDLVNFHECAHLTALDLAALDDKALKAQKTKPDEHTELLFKRGNEFEAAYLADLKREVEGTGGTVVEIAKHAGQPSQVGFSDPRRPAAPAPTSFTKPHSWTATSSATRISCARCRVPPRSATTATKSSTPSSAATPRPGTCCSSRSTATCWPKCSSSTRTRCTWCSARASR